MSGMNKIWFITGISRGLGLALAQAVVQQGGTVIGTTRDGRLPICCASELHRGQTVGRPGERRCGYRRRGDGGVAATASAARFGCAGTRAGKTAAHE